MNNFITFIYGTLHKNIRKLFLARRNNKALWMLAHKNPTCRITSSNLVYVTMGKSVSILNNTSLNTVSISDFSYVSNDSVLNNVEIGKFCSIGPRVQIGLAPHPAKIFISTYPAFYSEENTGCPSAFRNDKIFDDSIPQTVLANDIWIGANVIIPGGIHIGSGAILAAGAVVVKDVPPYAIVGGNPAKVIRYRFSAEQIKILLESEWWDWPIEKIIQNVNVFSEFDKFSEISLP